MYESDERIYEATCAKIAHVQKEDLAKEVPDKAMKILEAQKKN